MHGKTCQAKTTGACFSAGSTCSLLDAGVFTRGEKSNPSPLHLTIYTRNIKGHYITTHARTSCLHPHGCRRNKNQHSQGVPGPRPPLFEAAAAQSQEPGSRIKSRTEGLSHLSHLETFFLIRQLKELDLGKLYL